VICSSDWAPAPQQRRTLYDPPNRREHPPLRLIEIVGAKHSFRIDAAKQPDQCQRDDRAERSLARFLDTNTTAQDKAIARARRD
jgi:hypothetical protein